MFKGFDSAKAASSRLEKPRLRIFYVSPDGFGLKAERRRAPFVVLEHARGLRSIIGVSYCSSGKKEKSASNTGGQFSSMAH